MIKMINAFTVEVDIIETAVADIIDGLGEDAFLKNSVALVHCHNEFITTGVLDAVCKALPCETAGISCSIPAVNGTDAALALTVTVLTSETCRFKVTNFDAREKDNVHELMTNAAKELILRNEDGSELYPALVMPYMSFVSYASGDMTVRILSSALPGIPLFGSLPISDEVDFSGSYTIYTGEVTEHGGVLIAIYGDIAPNFRMTSVREGTVFNTGGYVNSAHGNILYEIDGMKAWDYVVAKGVATKDTYHGILGQPMVFNNTDGSQNMRNCLNIDFKTGSLILAGDTEEGAYVDFAIISADDIRHSATGITAEIEEAAKDASVIFIYSCATRLWTLGPNTTDEIKIISDILKDKSFTFAYSGGEIIPMLVNGKYVNTFQNNNLTVCTF
jgi:hypothetical protein